MSFIDLKAMYSRVFVLPSVADRRMVEGALKRVFYPHLRKEWDDTYIYYLIMKHAFFAASVFSLLYWVSHVFGIQFNLLLFSIDLGRTNFVHDMIWSYPFVVSTILLVIFLPYGWLLFRENIDFDTCDLIRWNKDMLTRTRGDRKKLLKSYRLAAILCLIAMYGSFGLPEEIIRHKMYESLANSEVFFVIVLVGYAWLYSVIMYALVLCGAGYWQHKKRLGPRYQTEQSNNTTAS